MRHQCYQLAAQREWLGRRPGHTSQPGPMPLLQLMTEGLYTSGKEPLADTLCLGLSIVLYAGGAAYLQLLLRCPLDVAQQRNAQRPPPAWVPPEVLRRTAEAFEDPTASPLIWDRGTLELDGAVPLPGGAVLWERIWAAWGPAPPRQPEAAGVVAGGC